MLITSAVVATLRNSQGNAYSVEGLFEEAIAEYEHAIALDRSLPEPYFNLGSVYTKLGDHDRAIQSYQRSIELDPLNHAAYTNLGNVYADQGMFHESIESYRKSAELGEVKACFNLIRVPGTRPF